MTEVRYRISDGVANVTLDVPPVNALDAAGWNELTAIVREVGAHPDVGVIVLSGAGRGFCAGVDINELAADSSRIVDVNRGCFDAFAAVYDAPVPVIAAIHGFAVGGGLALAGACDLILAAKGTKLGLPEIDRGALGGGSHLNRMFPQQKARMLMFTGRNITVEEAFRFGSIEAIVPSDELLERAGEIAMEIAAKSRRAVQLAKESLNGVEVPDLKRSYRFEQGFTFELYTSPDSQEARDAFVEGREADFGGDR